MGRVERRAGSSAAPVIVTLRTFTSPYSVAVGTTDFALLYLCPNVFQRLGLRGLKIKQLLSSNVVEV